MFLSVMRVGLVVYASRANAVLMLAKGYVYFVSCVLRPTCMMGSDCLLG